MKIKLPILILIFALLISTFGIPAYAKENAAITETVNLAYVTKNQRGAGYDWANLTNTLTLDGLRIVTDDEYGLKLPEEATVILKGDNYISASACALFCSGMITFQGGGTLTLVSDGTGMECASLYRSDLIRIRDCKIDITAKETGISLTSSRFSLMGGELKINITGDSESRRAISGREVEMSSGSLTANAPVYGSEKLFITGLNATVTSSNGAALECPKGVTLEYVNINAGDSADSLAKTDTYAAQSCIKLKSTASSSKRGILFNAVYPRIFDYLIFLFIILALAALIAVPLYLKKKRTERLIADYEAAHPAKKKTAAKKNGKGKKH